MTAQKIISEHNEVYFPFIFFSHSILLSIRDWIEMTIVENKFIGAVKILFFRVVFVFCLSLLFLLVSSFPSQPIFLIYVKIF